MNRTLDRSSHARIVARVVTRAKQADLAPPLGDPGGPCQVMKRINDHVRNPALRDEMIDDIAHGHSLPNADAQKIYPIDHEPGAGLVKQLLITPHAQYRMDLRGVKVEDVRKALASHGKILNDLKAQKNPAYDRMSREVQSGKFEWVDPKSGLFIAVDVSGYTARLVTTYWKGKSDPRAVPPTVCKL